VGYAEQLHVRGGQEMKTYTATLVTKQYQTVRVTVPDEYTPEQIEIAICENASLSDGEFENDIYDLKEDTTC
jgi:hypothetical protein